MPKFFKKNASGKLIIIVYLKGKQLILKTLSFSPFCNDYITLINAPTILHKGGDAWEIKH